MTRSPLPALHAGTLVLCAVLAACQPTLEAPVFERSAEEGLQMRVNFVQSRPGERPAWLQRSGPEAMPNKVSDAALGAAVSAALARDALLNTTQIDVDNAGGHVILFGIAPDAGARQRAAQLAAQVDGVLSVQNELRVPATR
jgi:hypothetical protein